MTHHNTASRISRRRIVQGAAWSAPVILATATIPVWAASGEPTCSPALILKPTATGYKDKAGAYTEWLVPEGIGRVRFDLVGGAGGAATSFTPQYLTDVTNAALAGGGAGAQLSGVLAVKSGDILRVWAGNGGVGSVAGAQPAFGGEGYAAGGSAGGDLGTDNTGQGGMLRARPYQKFKPLDEDDKTLDMRFIVTGGTAGRSGVAGTLGEAMIAILDENDELKFMPMSEPWFESYDFPRYYTYEGDSVVEGEKGTGGADATGSYRGKGGSGALLSHTHGKLSLTSVASGGGAGYGGGGAGLNIWTIGAYLESVFGRQVQFENEGNIYSLSTLSSGGGAGGSYINHEVVSDFALATAQNANPTAGVRSPGSAALYSCTENATLNTPHH